MDDDDGAGCCDAVRTYDCLCLTADVWVMEDLQWFCASLVLMDLQWFFAIVHFFVGGSVSSPATSPSWTTVWDLLHFPPAYLLPNMMWLRLFSDTLNSVQASLAVPSFMYLHCNHKHRAATSSLVGLFLGTSTILAESEWGSNFFSNFYQTTSAVEVGLGSCTRLRYLSRKLIWTSSLTAALRTRLNVWGSVILPSAEMLAAAVLAWAIAFDIWSNILMMSYHSSCFLVFSSRDLKNSHPSGTSEAGSVTSMLPVTRN